MSSPILGGLTLSGATHVVITDNDYVMEHQVPGMDGGIVERIGSDLFRIKIQGFSSSGDADKPQFLAMLNTSQSLNVPSMAPSTSLFSGSVYIKEFNIGPLAGRGYPVYSWASGEEDHESTKGRKARKEEKEKKIGEKKIHRYHLLFLHLLFLPLSFFRPFAFSRSPQPITLPFFFPSRSLFL